MRGGRKNLKRAAEEEAYALQEGESIMQVVSLRGSNLIEVMDASGLKSLAIFPAKFQKSMWIKRGSFVIIDGRGRDMALESGSKVACMVTQVLFHDQVRVLQKSREWPDIFKTATLDNGHPQSLIPEKLEELNSSDDDDLPPLEANLNRVTHWIPLRLRVRRDTYLLTRGLMCTDSIIDSLNSSLDTSIEDSSGIYTSLILCATVLHSQLRILGLSPPIRPALCLLTRRTLCFLCWRPCDSNYLEGDQQLLQLSDSLSKSYFEFCSPHCHLIHESILNMEMYDTKFDHIKMQSLSGSDPLLCCNLLERV